MNVQKPSAKQFPKHNTAIYSQSLTAGTWKDDKLSKFGIYFSFWVPIFKKVPMLNFGSKKKLQPNQPTIGIFLVPTAAPMAPPRFSNLRSYTTPFFQNTTVPEFPKLPLPRSGNVCQSWRWNLIPKKPELNLMITRPETNSKQTPLKIGHPLKGNEKVFQPYIFSCENVSFREGTSPTWILEGFFAFCRAFWSDIFFETLNICWGEKNECVKFAVTMKFTKTKVYESMCMCVYYIYI